MNLVVHALYCQQLFLQKVLRVDKEGLGLANHAGDLLSGSLRLLLKLDLVVDLRIDLFLQFHVLKLVVIP